MARLLAALCFVVSVSYGSLYYGFAVLITEPAAGGEFSRGVLSAAYGGSVLTSGLAAIPVGRAADRFGVRWLIAGGAVAGAAGLLAFSAAETDWQVLAIWWLVLGPVAACTFYEPAYVAIQQAFDEASRARAIAVLTLAAGFSGPIFTPLTGALVEERSTGATRPASWPRPSLLRRAGRGPVRTGAPPTSRQQRSAAEPRSVPVWRPGCGVHSRLAVLAYGAIEALVLHRDRALPGTASSLSRGHVLGRAVGLLRRSPAASFCPCSPGASAPPRCSRP